MLRQELQNTTYVHKHGLPNSMLGSTPRNSFQLIRTTYNSSLHIPTPSSSSSKENNKAVR